MQVRELFNLFFRRRLDVRGKIRHLKDLPNLDHVAVLRRAALHPIHDLLLRLGFQHPIAADHFLGFDKRTVRNAGLASGKRQARAGRQRLQPVQRKPRRLSSARR